jgi:hypothetical protein
MCLHVVFNLARKIYRNLVSFHYFLNYRNPKSWTWLMWADNYLIVAWVCESEGFLNVWGTCRLLWKLSILCTDLHQHYQTKAHFIHLYAMHYKLISLENVTTDQLFTLVNALFYVIEIAGQYCSRFIIFFAPRNLKVIYWISS